jgi:hypothetical protein
MVACLLAWPAVAGEVSTTEAEDYRIKREAVYEFVKPPTLTRDGDRVTVSFETKGLCDVVVAIEDSDGRILRHLAYGVLGANAPEPFKKNSRAQQIVWDGKDNSGRYIDDKDGIIVRVSLGLKPQLEKTLFWHPKKRIALERNPLMAVQPEGVYVYDGGGVETVRLFGHDGKYLRTVYPFPAGDVEKIKGIRWHTFADGHKAPQPKGFRAQHTFLFGGGGPSKGGGGQGSGCTGFAVHEGSIALVSGISITSRPQWMKRLNRLGVGQALSAHELDGPLTGLPHVTNSIAFSPDKKWLYLAGLYENRRHPDTRPGWTGDVTSWGYGVYRMEFDGDRPAQLWLGHPNKRGKDDQHFDYPASLCVDAKGHVYVADHFNDRVQIFSPEAKLLGSVPVRGPAVVQIHHKTQQLYVFSWNMSFPWSRNIQNDRAAAPSRVIPPHLSVFKAFESDQGEPKLARPKLNLPLEGATHRGQIGGVPGDLIRYRAVLNSYTDSPTLWMCIYHPGGPRGSGSDDKQLQISRLRVEEKKIVVLERWNDEVIKAVTEYTPRGSTRRRMHVDRRTGLLYVEGSQPPVNTQHFAHLNRIDPETGAVSVVPLPFSANDFTLDDWGHLYLRAGGIIGRYDLDSMREVPFDYGEERRGVKGTFGERSGNLISALVLDGSATGGSSGGHWWQSGMRVNSLGDLVVGWGIGKDRANIQRIYPGRSTGRAISVFDKHGKPILLDALQGAPNGFGTLIDNQRNLYSVFQGARVYGKNSKALQGTGSLMKFKPGEGKFLAAHGAAIPLGDRPVAGLPSVQPIQGGHKMYVEGAEWIFPGAGFAPFPGDCLCWNSLFALDHFGRFFVPQHLRQQVAVLDTNGNLVVQVGRYGNVDDGVPLVEDPRFRSEPPRSIGGDEVALAYPCYVGTHSDRRLFIADGGNDCIRSVKMGYHVDVRLPLRDTPEKPAGLNP